MCGRFALTATLEEIAATTGAGTVEPFPPRYNIAPTQPVLVITRGAGGEAAALLARWGLVPAWVKDPREFTLLINARAETAADKPSFRTAIRHRRALIPASGFYEWHRPSAKNARKQPYWIRPKEGGLVLFGALLETWLGEDGSEIDTACILTTAANNALAPIHHRMPVVIRPEDQARWLDCVHYQPGDVADMMRPIADDYFEAVPVGDKVNKTANAGPEIQLREERGAQTASAPDSTPEEPAPPVASDQGDLFG